MAAVYVHTWLPILNNSLLLKCLFFRGGRHVKQRATYFFGVFRHEAAFDFMI